MQNIEPSTKGQFKDFLKTVISFTGDLSSLTCPAFFLNGLSLLEYGTYWGDHPTCFTAISQATEAQERMLAVTRWFMSTLWGSYASRCTHGLNEKKPYNPILGEQFKCKLGEVACVCEQVCHHPPISAFYLQDDKAGVSLNGHCGQKSKFKGTSIKIEQVGRAVLHVKDKNEQFLIDFPDLMIRGVLTGAAFIELSGVCTIMSTSGAKAVIEFVPKPWFSGDYHHIKGTISHQGKDWYSLSGRWSHQSFHTPLQPVQGEKTLLFDAEAAPMADRCTPPYEEQLEIDSHRLWGKVSDALKVKDFQAANVEKTKIEEWQRKVRKERESSSTAWEPSLFTFIHDKQTHSSYVQNTVQLKSSMVGKPYLDDGAWVYNKSLHLTD
ncbi:hypothetical protein BDF14DRAFT_1729488 [Spinellus fusiger]|nr:hypothetical protein BDF14DRAFT_1729488 [Spinellus fusiger]